MRTIFDLQSDLDIDLKKSDVEQGIIVACASSDAVDRQGDQIPFDLMKATMQKFASVLGIREMHQPKAVGRLIKWWADEKEKKIYVEIQLSKSRDGQDALTKIKEGVLKGLSIGGKALSWAYEGTKRVIKAMTLSEISIVDVPANQDAMISLVKRLDSDVNKEVRAFLSEWEPALLKDWDESQHPRGPDGKFGEGDHVRVTEARSKGGASHNIVVERNVSGDKYQGRVLDGPLVGTQVTGDLVPKVETVGSMRVPEPSFMHDVYGSHEPAPDTQARLRIQNLSDTKAQAMIDEAKAGGGFTRSFTGQPEPTTGYTFAEKPGNSIDPAQLNPSAITSFANGHISDLSQSGNFLGGYFNPDTGKFDLDVSTNIQDKSEALARATAAGQTSIWDVVNHQDIFTGIQKLQKSDDPEADPEADLKRRGKVVGIARKDGEPLTPPKGYPTDWTQYADPANWSWPCDETSCSNAVGRYNQGAGKDGYSPREWSTLGRRIARIATKSTGGTYSYKAADKSIVSEEAKMNKSVEDFLKEWDPGQLGKVKKPAVPDEASGLVVDKCNDQGGTTKPILNKKAADFLKEWDPEFLKDWDESAHPRGPDGKFGEGYGQPGGAKDQASKNDPRQKGSWGGSMAVPYSGRSAYVPLGAKQAGGFRVGQSVKVREGAGLASNKLATVVERSMIRTDGRGIPINIEGAYKPIEWGREVAIQYEDGRYDTMFANSLIDMSKSMPAEEIATAVSKGKEKAMEKKVVLSPLGDALSKLSGEPLVKQNVTGLIHDVQGQVKAALSGLSSDPDKAKSMLEQVAAALSVVEDQATEPGLSAEASEGGTAGDGGTTAAIDAAAPSGSKVEKTDATPSVDASEADAEASDPEAEDSSSSKPSGTVTHTTEITPPSSSSDSTGETEKAFKGFAKMQEELQNGFQKAMDEAVEKINKAAAYRPARPMGDGVPIGDLPPVETIAKVDGVIEALGEGDLQKALTAAGGEFHKLEDRVEAETSKALAAAGITIRKYVIAPAPEESK